MTRLGLLLAVLAAFAVLGSAGAAASGGDSAVVAVNTRDGSQVFRFAFTVRRVLGDVVDTSNAAVAYASCESCETVAIALQLVLVSGSPEVVTPENLAIAINEGCTLCETVASAYQYVLGVGDGLVHFSADGNRQLAALRQDLARLRQANLAPDELQAAVDGLIQRLRDTVENELVAAGASAQAQTAQTPTTAQETQPQQTAATEPTPTQETPTETTPTETTPTTESTTTEPATTEGSTAPTPTEPAQTETTETATTSVETQP